MEQIELTVNGFTRTLLVKPHETLLVTLRERLYLTGTKLGCDEATCGCCTVLLDGKPVLSCITPTMRCEGQEILTIEGVAAGDGLHPVQKHMVENGGMQCGFCTPGVVMTAIPFLEENRDASIDDIKEGLSGNLCRCTGYKKIIEAVKDAAEEMRK